jgi:hypothetical protein
VPIAHLQVTHRNNHPYRMLTMNRTDILSRNERHQDHKAAQEDYVHLEQGRSTRRTSIRVRPSPDKPRYEGFFAADFAQARE